MPHHQQQRAAARRARVCKGRARSAQAKQAYLGQRAVLDPPRQGSFARAHLRWRGESEPAQRARATGQPQPTCNRGQLACAQAPHASSRCPSTLRRSLALRTRSCVFGLAIHSQASDEIRTCPQVQNSQMRVPIERGTLGRHDDRARSAKLRRAGRWSHEAATSRSHLAFSSHHRASPSRARLSG